MRRARSTCGDPGHVTFDDVHFAYGRGPEVLHGIDLDVAAGTTVALVGHTGAGKSTIAKLLARFYDPTRGHRDRRRRPARRQQHSLRRQLGIVPQEGFLFAGTVAENIAFGRPAATREEIIAAAPRSAPTSSSTSSRTATTRSSANAARGSHSGNASSSRSPARCSPTRGS